MKTFKIFAIAIMAVCLASCGGKKNSEEKEEIVVTADSSDLDFGSSSSDVNESSSSSASSSTDWDEVLDEYDAYITEYIAVVEKASNEDMSALADCASLLSQAQSLGNKLENAQGEMSSSQVARYTRISARLADAAAKLQ